MLFKPDTRVRFTQRVQAELYKKGIRHALDTWIVCGMEKDVVMLRSSRACKRRYYLTVEANQALFDPGKSV